MRDGKYMNRVVRINWLPKMLYGRARWYNDVLMNNGKGYMHQNLPSVWLIEVQISGRLFGVWKYGQDHGKGRNIPCERAKSHEKSLMAVKLVCMQDGFQFELVNFRFEKLLTTTNHYCLA